MQNVLLTILGILIANLPVGALMGKFPALVGISYLALLLVTPFVTQTLVFTPAEAQSVTIEMSAGTFFGHAALRVIIGDDSADDVNDSILVDIEADGALSDSGSFIIEDTTDGSQRFEFFLVHEDSNLAGGAGIDGFHDPPIMIRFGGNGSHLFTGGPLFDEITFEITRTGEVATADYEQVAAELNLDRPTPYGSTSIVRISIEDQDANLNPTDRDSFDIDVDDMNGELFVINGGDFTADPITFVETGDNSGIFEAEVSLDTDFHADDEIVDLTLNDQANYDIDLTRSDGTTIDINAPDINGSIDTDVVSFEIDDVDGEIADPVGLDPPISGGAPTFSSELTFDFDIQDSDQNVDSANEDDLANALTVEVDSPGGDFESVPLTETGDNTGIFEIDLSNGRMEITFLADGDNPVTNNGILEFRADDVEQDILVYYLDPLDDNSNTEVTIYYEVNLDLMPGLINVPGVAGSNDNFTMTLVDGDLNDDSQVEESYMVTLSGSGRHSFVTEDGDVIGQLASLEIAINQAPAEFDSPVTIVLEETGANTGIFEADIEMADIINSVNIAGQVGRIDITYVDGMPPATNTGTIILPPAIAVGAVDCITPTGGACADDFRPRWGLDRLRADLTVYPENSGGHTLEVDFGEGITELISFDGDPNDPFTTTVTMSTPYPGGFTGPSETISMILLDDSGAAVTNTVFGDFIIQGHRTELSLDPIADVAAGESVTISGRLVDLDTNTGIAEKTIQFSGDGVDAFASSRAITDSNGDFSIQEDSGQADSELLVIATFAGDILYQESDDDAEYSTGSGPTSPTITIDHVSSSQPKWDQDIEVSGTVTGGSSTVTVQWNENGDETQGVPISATGSWSASYTYGSDDIGSNRIVAILVADSGQVEDTSSPRSIVVQKHATSLSLDETGNVNPGESFTLSGTLVDLDAMPQSGLGGKVITPSSSADIFFLLSEFDDLDADAEATTAGDGSFSFEVFVEDLGDNPRITASFGGDNLYLPSQGQVTLPINAGLELIIESVNPSRLEPGQGTLVRGIVDGGSAEGMMVVLNWGDGQQSPPIPVHENRWEAWHQYNDEGDRPIIARLIDVQGLEVDDVQGSIVVAGSFPVVPVVVGSGVAAGITLGVLKATNKGPFKKPIPPPPRLVPIGKIEPVHLIKPDREFADLSAAESELEQISKKMQSLSFEDVKSAIIEDFQSEEVMRRGLTQLVSIVKNKKIDETEVVSTVSSEAAIRMSESTIGDYFRSDFLKGLGFAAEIKRGQAPPEGKKLRAQFKGFMVDFIPYFDTLMMEGYVGAALRYLEPNLDVPIFKLLLRINSEIQIRNIESGVSAGRNIVTLKDVTFVLKPNIMGVEIGPGHSGAGLQNVLQGFTVPVPSREINLPLKKLKIDRITLWVSNPKG